MNFVQVKQESYKLPLNLVLQFNTDGHPDKLSLAPSTNLQALLSSKIDSECPACQSQLAIHITLYDDSNEHPSAAPKSFDYIKLEYDANPLVEESGEVKLEWEAVSGGESEETAKRVDNEEKTKQGAENNDSTLLCFYCLEVFTNKIELADHHLFHRLSCRFCQNSKEYSDKKTLKYHVRKHHLDKWPETDDQVECPTCHRRLNKKGLQFHLKVCKPPQKKAKNMKSDPKRGKVYFCSYCFQRFDDRTKQREHNQNHELVCRLCKPSRVYSQLDSLKKHARWSHFELHPLSKDTRTCPTCGQKFRLLGFETHIKHCDSYRDGKPFCKICNKTFSSKKYVTQHIKAVHEGRRTHACDVCGQQFINKTTFDVHYTIHQPDAKPFKCDMCPDEGFRTKFKMKKHIDTVHLQRPIFDPRVTCDECGLTMRKKYFKKHMLRHTKGRTYQCSFCDKSFFNNHNLTEHEKIHTDSRPFPCPVCGKAFRQKHAMHSHMRLHTGEKPYHCEICLKRFSDRGHFRSHMIRHENEMGVVLDKSIKKFSELEQKKEIKK